MLEKKYNSKESEKKWQDFWIENNIYKFDINSKKIYSIDTPPPTVSGKIHIGHVFSYTQIEIIARYMRMKGYNIFFPFGFDDNGLPTERLVERKIGKKAHQISREEFNKNCLEITHQYEAEFKELFKSLGFSADWGLIYSTISEKAQKASQKSFLDLYKKDLVYNSKSPSLWCTECKTSIAQAELDTKEVETTFNYIKFRVPELNKDLEIATTRPELLPGCVAVFVNPNDKSKSEFINKEIEIPLFGFKVKILSDDKVDIEKGTGAVMCCTFGDVTDVAWWKEYKLPIKNIIDKNGFISEDIKKYGGLKSQEARKLIIQDLKESGFLIKQEVITHQVGVHERCGTPVEFSVSKQWYIDILNHKSDFIEAGNKIEWYPKNMKARYNDWVENLQWDWGISRQRYFGVPFPVWYCEECGKLILADEKDLPVNPLTCLPKKSCECGCEKFIPEKDVMDTWATSSLTPLINLNWASDEEPENNDFIKKMMPMSLRPNAHDIIRTWDFYTIVKNLYHTGKLPWENIMISGHVMAQKGEKISKRKNNSNMEPENLLKNFSADAIRYWTANGRLGNDILFSEEELRSANKFINKLWNVSKFALMHLEDYDPDKKPELWPMDKYILSKMAKMLRELELNLDKYESGLGLKAFEKFFWEYCDNYIEIVKHRLYNPDIFGKEARESGQEALYQTILQILKTAAIYIPHITEEIYQSFFIKIEKTISIHLTRILDYLSKFEIDESLIKNGDMIIDLISETRKFKSENNISLRAKIKTLELEISTELSEIFDFEKILTDIKNTSNTSEIKIIGCESGYKIKNIVLE
ncbi:MAG: valine--tRNA ligase [Oscillospiraceae bacterium]|nr:valine--tRNA ligase [Oscillospiraceae bacterium]